MSEGLAQRASSLEPWRYNHRTERISIRGNSEVAELFDSVGRPVFRGVLRALMDGHSVGELRAIDIGCLEGQHADVLCETGFKQVVAVDLSEKHLERARFLLSEVHGYSNASVLKGNATDLHFAATLGKFNLVFVHGLLYHLKDPLLLFDALEALRPSDGPFWVLLGTQFKGSYWATTAPQALAELQVKPLPKSEQSDSLLFSPSDESVFERLSLRLNPAAIYAALRAYGYGHVLAYDDPYGTEYSLSVNLIASPTEDVDLLAKLRAIEVAGVTFYEWNGRSVNSLDFSKNWKARLFRFLMHLMEGRFLHRLRAKRSS